MPWKACPFSIRRKKQKDEMFNETIGQILVAREALEEIKGFQLEQPPGPGRTDGSGPSGLDPVRRCCRG